jgi:hypothetical protein
MEFYIKTLDFLERVMNGVMAIDPGQQPFISRDLEELNEMRDSLLKASGQAERSHEAKAELPLHDVSNRAIFSAYDLAKATKLTLLEKIALRFIKRKYFVDKIESSTIVYKMWRGKTYILDHFNNPPKHFNCRCSLHGC